MKNIYLSICLLFISNISFAQTGKITGKVISSSSGQSLAGATLLLNEKSKIIAADQNGNFSFSKLDTGTYSIKCTFSGYEGKVIEEIIVKRNEITTVNISLEGKKNDAVIVTSNRVKAAGETVATLLIAQKNSDKVSDGITADIIKKTPDSKASDAIKRISGASIQDDRFIIIRGLNDRYNASFINGAPLPSTESDRKAFSFDIFPSAILDNLIIYKTATPDLPGDFAGGVINITTKSIPAKSFTAISIGQGFNNTITGKDRFFSANKGKKDWLGLDDGTRGLPTGLPTSKEIRSMTPTKRNELAKLYADRNWAILESKTKPNLNFQISQGLNIERKGKEFFGGLFSVNYNRNFTFRAEERLSYDPIVQTTLDNIPVKRNNYRDSIYNDETIIGLLGNVSFKINNRNNISWKNNYSVNTDNQILKRAGQPDYDGDSTTFLKDVVRFYTSNKILSSQLIGEHQVGPFKTKINWIGNYTTVNRDMPTTDRTSYAGNTSTPNDLVGNFSTGSIVPFSGSGNMFSTITKENIKSFKIDITQPYTFLKNTQNFVKIGASNQKRVREFSSRLLGLVPADNNFDFSLLYLPAEQIFAPQNIGKISNTKNGFTLQDGTAFTSAGYDASSILNSAYIMNDQRIFKKFRLIYGIRVEKFNQKLNYTDDFNKPASIDSTITDYLPSINFVYSPTSKMNVRLSFSKTLNRPEFRELAPYIFFENVTGFNYTGNPTLVRAEVKNYDFRYEFYPGKAQIFSVSAFHKEFKNPIEIIQQPNTSSYVVYANITSAKVTGLEAEFRTLISTLVGVKREKSILNKFTLSANAALIKSSVKIERLFLIPVEQLLTDRSMQGQSPYLLNASLGFADEKIGLSSTISANRVGDRIFIAGTALIPNIYERARNVIDFQLTKSLLKNKLELKFNARDLLSQNIVFYNDVDQNKKFSELDTLMADEIAPKVFSFTATYKF